MPSGGAWLSSSMLASTVRAANTQWSPLLNWPPAGARPNSTRMPCSRNRRVPAAGIWISPAAPGALRSATWLPFSRRTRPAWSQRRTRVLRAGSVACWALAGNMPAGKARSNCRVRAPSSTPPATRMRRSSPGRLCSSRQSSVTSTQSPSWKRSTSSRPMLSTVMRSRAGLMWLTREATVALSRDHLKVAVPSAPPRCTSTRYSWFSRPR